MLCGREVDPPEELPEIGKPKLRGNVCGVLNIVDAQLHANRVAVHKISTKHDRVDWGEHCVEPAGGDKKCLPHDDFCPKHSLQRVTQELRVPLLRDW